eukprot:1373773-Pyramimonas_sp.AAC.1
MHARVSNKSFARRPLVRNKSFAPCRMRVVGGLAHLYVARFLLATGPDGPRSRLQRPQKTRLTVHRRRQYLGELFGIDELEEFRRGLELVGRPDQNGQCEDLGK